MRSRLRRWPALLSWFGALSLSALLLGSFLDLAHKPPKPTSFTQMMRATAGSGNEALAPTMTPTASVPKTPSVSSPPSSLPHLPDLPKPEEAPAGSHLVFYDDFSGSSLDSTKWLGCFPWAPTGCNNPPNNSLEWFTPSQAKVANDQLHIVAEKKPIEGTDENGNPKQFAYRSANITTAGKFDFTYGYVQFKANFPIGRGLWPAVWMLASDEHFPPEIDILEVQNLIPHKVAEVFHGATKQLGQDVYDVPAGWHTYGLLWEPGSLTWYIDGVAHLHVTTEVPSEPMYLLITMAVGGDWPGPPTAATTFPAVLSVADLQVWQW